MTQKLRAGINGGSISKIASAFTYRLHSGRIAQLKRRGLRVTTVALGSFELLCSGSEFQERELCLIIYDSDLKVIGYHFCCTLLVQVRIICFTLRERT